MTTPSPNRGPLLSILAIGLGIFAVAAATASLFIEPTWGLRATALVLILLGLGLARVAGRQPPPVDGP